MGAGRINQSFDRNFGQGSQITVVYSHDTVGSGLPANVGRLEPRLTSHLKDGTITMHAKQQVDNLSAPESNSAKTA